MSLSFELPEVDWCTVGAVGEPGRRTFYLQARQGDRLVSLKLEKQQVAALAQLLDELLADRPSPDELPDAQLDLVEPVLEEWAVGAIQLAYDEPTDRVVLLAEELAGEGEDGAVGRLAVSRTHAAALSRRGAELISAGRPPCPLCGYPLDPAGHSCPRTNGHQPPRL